MSNKYKIHRKCSLGKVKKNGNALTDEFTRKKISVKDMLKIVVQIHVIAKKHDPQGVPPKSQFFRSTEI